MLDKDMARGRGGYVPTIVPTEHYKVRHIRMSDEEWLELKQNRKKSQKSWNQFIKGINQIIKKKGIK